MSFLFYERVHAMAKYKVFFCPFIRVLLIFRSQIKLSVFAQINIKQSLWLKTVKSRRK